MILRNHSTPVITVPRIDPLGILDLLATGPKLMSEIRANYGAEVSDSMIESALDDLHGRIGWSGKLHDVTYELEG